MAGALCHSEMSVDSAICDHANHKIYNSLSEGNGIGHYYGALCHSQVSVDSVIQGRRIHPYSQGNQEW